MNLIRDTASSFCCSAKVWKKTANIETSQTKKEASDAICRAAPYLKRGCQSATNHLHIPLLVATSQPTMETQSNHSPTMEPVKQTFPFKLYHTIEWASDSEFSSALSWSPEGNAFVVHDREVVVEHIIPKFFDHKKWRSFVSCGDE